MKNKIIALILNSVIIVFALVSVVLASMNYKYYIFIFYTHLSNMMALVASLIYVIYLSLQMTSKKEHIPLSVNLLRFISLGMVTTTFLITLLVLTPYGGIEGFKMLFLRVPQIFVHFLIPVISMVSFIFFEEHFEFKHYYVFYSLIPTIIYGLVLVPLNIAHIIDGPYPFLKVTEQPIYQSILWTIGIFGFVYLIGFMYYQIKKHLYLKDIKRSDV